MPDVGSRGCYPHDVIRVTRCLVKKALDAFELGHYENCNFLLQHLAQIDPDYLVVFDLRSAVVNLDDPGGDKSTRRQVKLWQEELASAPGKLPQMSEFTLPTKKWWTALRKSRFKRLTYSIDQQLDNPTKVKSSRTTLRSARLTLKYTTDLSCEQALGLITNQTGLWFTFDRSAAGDFDPDATFDVHKEDVSAVELLELVLQAQGEYRFVVTESCIQIKLN